MVEKIEDAADLRNKLEKDIFELVQEYEKQTMLYVDHVYLYSETNEDGQNRATKCSVTVKLQ